MSNTAVEPSQGISTADAWESQLTQEWLITNGRGGFAAGTVLGLPTRRYHGLLIAAARPPLERWLLLSSVLERVSINGRHDELANYAFGENIHPRGYQHLREFNLDLNEGSSSVRFAYEGEGYRLLKVVQMMDGADEVRLRYRLDCDADAEVTLALCPFVAMRDFHALTRAFDHGFFQIETEHQLAIDAHADGPRLWLRVENDRDGKPAPFEPRPDWWFGFDYSVEVERGQDHREDLFTPGWFRVSSTGPLAVTLCAVAEFEGGPHLPPARKQPPALDIDSRAGFSTQQRLTQAARAFVVRRPLSSGQELTTILAGYPWFGDWGRDTFIALPGLLLETGRFAEAKQVLEVFASVQRDGLIPNRFSDYGDDCDYNSIDASLWYLHAADAYVRASGDEATWESVLAPACGRIVDAFMIGTLFNIGVGADGLVHCGDESTQLTWMDAKCNEVVFTPRYGRPVEINALWYHGLCVLAERFRPRDAERSARYAAMADRVRTMFARHFWNNELGCLFDVVRDDYRDAAVRPNQIFAISLPHSPLERSLQMRVLSVVQRDLLTPYGLRSLSPRDPAYRGRYEGNPFERDSAYHQGTVWGWLVGPFVEAFLRVHDFSAEAKLAMRTHLSFLIQHLDEAGIGSVSEIFDGDEPHTPRGCTAQAWSVAELLRAWKMTEPDA